MAVEKTLRITPFSAMVNSNSNERLKEALDKPACHQCDRTIAQQEEFVVVQGKYGSELRHIRCWVTGEEVLAPSEENLAQALDVPIMELA